MKQIKYFFIGLLTSTVFIPLVDIIINILSGYQDLFMLKLTKKATEIQKEIAKMTDDTEEYQQTNAIGFQMPQEYYEEDDLND